MSTLFNTLFGNKTGLVNLDSGSFETQMNADKDAVLIDVRTKTEHMQQRIPNSMLLDIMHPQFVNELDKLDRSKSYYLYCRSGNRSYHAARQMVSMGFEKVFNLEPGIIGWYGPTEEA